HPQGPATGQGHQPDDTRGLRRGVRRQRKPRRGGGSGGAGSDQRRPRSHIRRPTAQGETRPPRVTSGHTSAPCSYGRKDAMQTPSLLSDLVVVDLSRALAGPHAAMMLGDLGARVIKVEIPEGGDDTRGWGPPFVSGDGSDSTYFMSCNRNKESVTADLKSAAGRELLTRLLRQADVVCENFRPGVLDRLGFPVEELHTINPRLIILSITGFGHDGPEAGRAGYDQILQGEAGLMSITGERSHPTKVGVPIGDILAGIYGAFGVLAALHERNSTNRGRVVRTSLLAAIVGALAFQGTRYTIADEIPTATGNHHPAIAPYGLFRTGDGAIQIAVGSESLWRRFADVVGFDSEHPHFATNAQRVKHYDALIDNIEHTLVNGTAAEWLQRLHSA